MVIVSDNVGDCDDDGLVVDVNDRMEEVERVGVIEDEDVKLLATELEPLDDGSSELEALEVSNRVSLGVLISSTVWEGL